MEKRYEIDSFNKLINVANKENVERLALDLANWLIYVTNAIDQMRESHVQETKGKINSEIVEASFIWVDDKKYDLKGVKLINSQTGEVNNIDFNK